jgi:O-acetyl-ADP-ribose deacetylase (regulator of RNase III)
MRRVTPAQLLGTWRVWSCSLEVHLTPCIVSCPPGDGSDVLVNPANERLEGTTFTPGECARQFGPRTTVLYPTQVVDGLVHGARGGDSSADDSVGAEGMAAACAELPELDEEGTRCRTGDTVVTRAHGELLQSYRHVVHAAAPFFGDRHWKRLLTSCFTQALHQADLQKAKTVALPLLGAGARGAPPAQAVAVAVAAVGEWGDRRSPQLDLRPLCVRFVVQDDEVANAMTEHCDASFRRISAYPSSVETARRALTLTAFSSETEGLPGDPPSQTEG